MATLKGYAYVAFGTLAGLLLVAAGLTWIFLFAEYQRFNPRWIFFDLLRGVSFFQLVISLATIAGGIAVLRQRARGFCTALCLGGLLVTALRQLGGLHPEHLVAFAAYGFGLIYLLTPRPRIPIWDRPATLDDKNWRRWLIASLQSEGVRPLRDRFLLGVLAMAVILMISLATALFVVLFTGRLIGIPIVILIALFLGYLMRRSRVGTWMQMASARTAENELQSPGSRRPVLYLRSFALDHIPHNEQKVMQQLRHLGPVIAIGRPDETVPPLGAARFYVDHAHWQAKVSDIVKVAQLVVWATGTTEGLRWELNHLRHALAPEKLVLWAHPHLLGLRGERAEAEWARFLTTLGGIFPVPLPQALGATRFITFSKTWEPRSVVADGADPQLEAARILLTIKETPAQARWRKTVRRAIAGGLILIVLVILLKLFGAVTGRWR